MHNRSSLLTLCLVVLAVLFPVNAGALQTYGASATAWWVIGALLFALPSTVVLLHLAHRDGSPLRSLQSGGHVAHASALGLWVAGTLATLAASVASVTYLARGLGVELPVVAQGVLAVALAVGAVFSCRSRMWGVCLIVGAIALLLVVVIAFAVLASHGSMTPVSGAPAASGGWLTLSPSVAPLGVVVLGLVGAHEPYQRAVLRPVSRAAVVVGIVAVVAGYVILSAAFAVAVPADVAAGFTSLADLGGSLNPTMAAVTALLVAVSFAATAVGTGGAFRELADDLRLPSVSTVSLIVGIGAVSFVGLPLLGSTGQTASAVTYSVTQGAAALLWAAAYVTWGVVALRVASGPAVRVAGVVTAVLGAVGMVGVLTGSFTPLVASGTWALLVVVLAVIAVGITWFIKAEGDHLHDVLTDETG